LLIARCFCAPPGWGSCVYSNTGEVTLADGSICLVARQPVRVHHSPRYGSGGADLLLIDLLYRTAAVRRVMGKVQADLFRPSAHQKLHSSISLKRGPRRFPIRQCSIVPVLEYLHPGVFGNWINDPLDSLLNDETAADQKLETKALLEIIPAGEATILYLKNCQIDVADSGDCESVRS